MRQQPQAGNQKTRDGDTNGGEHEGSRRIAAGSAGGGEEARPEQRGKQRGKDHTGQSMPSCVVEIIDVWDCEFHGFILQELTHNPYEGKKFQEKEAHPRLACST